MTFYEEMQSEADALITEFGQACTLVIPTRQGPAYNPTAGVPVKQPVKAVFTAYKAYQIDGTRILATDRRVKISAKGLLFAPTVEHTIMDAAGVSYKIVEVKPIQPAATVVCYEARVRR